MGVGNELGHPIPVRKAPVCSQLTNYFNDDNDTSIINFV